jgi:antitoxin VapB
LPISIKNPETEALARRLAELSGESITSAVHRAVVERVERMQRQRQAASRMERLREICERCAKRPVLGQSSEDEILGYDVRGIPGQ